MSGAEKNRSGTVLWDIHPLDSTVYFLVRHNKEQHLRGEVKFLSGCIRMDENNLTNACVAATLDATSLDTGQPDRDALLKSAGHLDTIHYPEITFLSTAIEPRPNGGYKIAGGLTMHGRTKEITIFAEKLSPLTCDNEGYIRCGTSAMLRLNQTDFGLNGNRPHPTGGLPPGNAVSVTIGVELIERKQDLLFAPEDAGAAIGA
jgi:polyisoprenoid-binding protein YceI